MLHPMNLCYFAEHSDFQQSNADIINVNVMACVQVCKGNKINLNSIKKIGKLCQQQTRMKIQLDVTAGTRTLNLLPTNPIA
jgi:hypothetical protein